VLIASDEAGPNGSPIWLYDLKNPPQNLKARGFEKIDDVESLAFSGGRYYALSSLTSKKAARGGGGGKKGRKDLVVRFTVENDTLNGDRAVDLQRPLLAALKRLPEMAELESDGLKSFEVESLTLVGSDAFLGLKAPQRSDGSSLIVKIPGFLEMVESGSFDNLTVSVFGEFMLSVEGCADPARISDLVKVPQGFLIVANCESKDNTGEIFLLPEGRSSSADLKPMLRLTGGRPEAITLTDKPGEALVGFDNGAKAGSEIRRVDLSLF
jgi:hypothetical protein